jgi:hypothetical protein
MKQYTNGTELKLVFSGHDSFQCRQLWLKKGYDFLVEGNNFNDENAVITLGVGKNMVSSIRFWMKAFNIIDQKDQITEFGNRLFNEETGYDPYLEDDASLWLLHYQLVKTGASSIYSIIINEFRKEKIHFSKESFILYMKRIAESNPEYNLNENTIGKDFIVFTNIYKNDLGSKDIEESYSGILSELEFLTNIGSGKDEQFTILNNEKDSLPAAVLLYSIIDNPNYGMSISLNSLELDFNSPGAIFALNRNGLLNKILEITSEYQSVTFTDHAGIKELQFKTKSSPYSILDNYYGR